MSNKKLISMTDFVLLQYEESSNQNEFEDNCYNYAKFLKRPLELGMFVPVDEDDEILYPEYVGGKEVIYDSFVHDDMMDRVLQYNEAKEKVLFKGFEVNSYRNDDGELIEYVNGYFKRIDKGKWIADNTLTIERLCNSFSGELTESAIKQLGL